MLKEILSLNNNLAPNNSKEVSKTIYIIPYIALPWLLPFFYSPNYSELYSSSLQLRRKGIKLTILWILGLLEKADHVAKDVFNCILP